MLIRARRAFRKDRKHDVGGHFSLQTHPRCHAFTAPANVQQFEWVEKDHEPRSNDRQRKLATRNEVAHRIGPIPVHLVYLLFFILCLA